MTEVSLAPWPQQAPSWLQSWVIWRFKNKPQPKPPGIPYPVPMWAYNYLSWCEWKRKGSPAGSRPANSPYPIPSGTWPWQILKLLNQAVPVKPPPPPPPPPLPVPPNSWTLPNPLVFTAWGWLDNSDFRDNNTALQKMYDAGVKTVALQIGQFGSNVPQRCRDFGFKVALWGDPTPSDGQALSNASADGYLPQIEGPYQYATALSNLQAGIGQGLALSTITTVSPFDDFVTLSDGSQSTGKAEALKSLGLTHCWTETYLEEASVNPVTLNWEAGHRGFPYHNPTIGTYHSQPVTSYQPWLDQYGRQIGIYLAETSSDADWATIKQLGV